MRDFDPNPAATSLENQTIIFKRLAYNWQYNYLILKIMLKLLVTMK